MFFRNLAQALSAAALLIVVPLVGAERNLWPYSVAELDGAGKPVSTEYFGPIFFEKNPPGENPSWGFRPIYLHLKEGNRETNTFLYPFFTWQKEDDYRYFTFFELINFRRQADSDGQTNRNFDVWPFYFSRDSGNSTTTYRAFFPVAGTIKSRFGYDQIKFVVFPLYADVVKNGGHTTHAPWPFLRFIHGAGEHGFEFWPLFGHRGRSGDYDSQFYLWPLFYRNVGHLSEAQPDLKVGALPFYTRESGPGLVSENFLWPLFGYTHRSLPKKYDETRYLWPFLVQGRGEERFVNRWGPFYTHSVVKGTDKTWVAWPIFRHSQWQENGLVQEQNQLLYFFYWSLTQRSSTNPAAAPAHKTHLWPLVSSWDNGAGLRQVQILSPFEVFFPTNEPIRQLYTPLVALYRFDQRAPNDTRHTMLFNLVSWKNAPEEREFHFGPLFSNRATPENSRIALALGLLSWQRRTGTGRWKFSLFDFRSDPAAKATSP